MKIYMNENILNEENNSDEIRDAVAKHFDYSLSLEFADVIQDLVDRALSDLDDDTDITASVMEAIDTGLIYTDDIWKVKRYYEDAELKDSTYEELFNDIYSIVDSIKNSNDDDDDDDDEIEESLANDNVNTRKELVDKLDKLNSTSFVVDEKDYITIQGSWRKSTRMAHKDFIDIRKFLNDSLGRDGYKYLDFEELSSRDGGKEFSCKLKLTLNNSFNEKCNSKRVKKSKKLNEGPGAGYEVRSTYYNLTGKLLDYKVTEKGNDRIFDCNVDMRGTVDEFYAASYGSSTGILHDLPIVCDKVIFDVPLDVEEYLNASEDAIVKIITESLKKATNSFIYGGGWSHSIYDGTLTKITEDHSLYGDTYYLNDLGYYDNVDIWADIKLANEEDIQKIDKLVDGYGYDIVYSVIKDEVAEDEFDDEDEAIEYAKKYGYDSVERAYRREEFNGDVNYDFDMTVWEKEDDDDVEEGLSKKCKSSLKNKKLKLGEQENKSANDSIVYEDEEILVKKTGRNYDFIATIENKTNETLYIYPDDGAEFEMCWISPYDWVGLTNDKDDLDTLDAIKNRKFTTSHEILDESFKLGNNDIQNAKVYNRFNYTIQEVRIDNKNKTFERGNFSMGKPDKKFTNRQEYERFIDQLKGNGYTEIKSEYKSLKNKSNSIEEDTVKKSNGKWTNRGDDGEEHGEFKTKKEADAQRKAMYAQGFKK